MRIDSHADQSIPLHPGRQPYVSAQRSVMLSSLVQYPSYKGMRSILPLPYIPERVAWSILKCAPRPRLQMIPPSLLVIPQGWGLIDLLLRATFSPAHPLANTFTLSLIHISEPTRLLSISY